MMRADIREFKTLRDEVRGGLTTLLVQAQQIRGSTAKRPLASIGWRLQSATQTVEQIIRDMELAARDQTPEVAAIPRMDGSSRRREFKRELGELIFSAVQWINDLGFDPLECLDLAIASSEEHARRMSDDATA